MVVRSSCSASWRRFCTHISQETSRAVRTLHVIFNLHHWLWRGSSFSNIQAMDVLPSSPPWTPLKASGTPTLPEMHGKIPGYIDTPIWNVIVECWQSANNANIRCSVHSPHLRVGLVFCRRARVLRRVASRRDLYIASIWHVAQPRKRAASIDIRSLHRISIGRSAYRRSVCCLCRRRAFVLRCVSRSLGGIGRVHLHVRIIFVHFIRAVSIPSFWDISPFLWDQQKQNTTAGRPKHGARPSFLSNSASTPASLEPKLRTMEGEKGKLTAPTKL